MIAEAVPDPKKGRLKMDEGLSAIYRIVWDKIYKTLGYDDFKIALMMPPGWRGDEQAKDIKILKIDIDNNKAILTMRDGHRVIFHYDPEGRIFEMLYGARLRGSPNYEAEWRTWMKEYDTLHEHLKTGRVSKNEYNRRYVNWRKRQPQEKDPDYLVLLNARSKGELSPEHFIQAYNDLSDHKWAAAEVESSYENIPEFNLPSDADIIHLSDDDAKIVLDLIENPPEASNALKAAMRQRNLSSGTKRPFSPKKNNLSFDPRRPKGRAALAKMINKLFELWQLPVKDRSILLGLDDTSTTALDQYKNGEQLSDSEDLIKRVSLLLSIHRYLRILFPHNREIVYRWISTPNRDFEDHSPLDVIKDKGLEGITMIEHYLRFELER